MPNGQSGSYPPGVAGSPIEPEKISVPTAEKNKIFFKGPTPIPQPLGVQALEEFNRQGGNLGDLESRRLRMRKDDPSVRALAKLIEPDRLSLLQKYGYDEDFISDLNTNIENDEGWFRGYPSFSSLNPLEKDVRGLFDSLKDSVFDPVQGRARDFWNFHSGAGQGLSKHFTMFLESSIRSLPWVSDDWGYEGSYKGSSFYGNPYMKELWDRQPVDDHGVPLNPFKSKGIEQGALLGSLLTPDLSKMLYSLKPVSLLDVGMLLTFSPEVGAVARMIGAKMGLRPSKTPIGNVIRDTEYKRLQWGDLPDLLEILETMEGTRPPSGVGGILQRGKARVVSLYDPSVYMFETGEKLGLARNRLIETSIQKIRTMQTAVGRIGTEGALFGPRTKDGLLKSGNLKGLSLNDIRSYPGKYDLTPKQRAWVTAMDSIDNDMRRLAKKNKIKIRLLNFEEGGFFAARAVMGKLDKKGNLLDWRTVGKLSGKVKEPGARKAIIEHQRIIPTGQVGDAIKDGFRYFSETEAQRISMMGLYKRIVDLKIENYLVEHIPWRLAGGATKEIEMARAASTKLGETANKYLQEFPTVTKGRDIPVRSIDALGDFFEEVKFDLSDLSRSRLWRIIQRGTLRQKTAQADMRTLLSDIPPQYRGSPVKDVILRKSSDPRIRKEQEKALRELAVLAQISIRKSKKDIKTANRAIQEVKEKAKIKKFEQEVDLGSKFPGQSGKIFLGEEAQSIATTFMNDMGGEVWAGLRYWNEVNAVGRLFKLSMDTSQFLIQQFFLTMAYPKIQLQSFRWGMQAIVDPKAMGKFLDRGTHFQTAQEANRLILASGGTTEFTEALGRGGLLSKLSFTVQAGRFEATIGPKTVLEPFQRGFETALDVSGILLKEGLVQAKHSAAEVASIENFINNVRGLTSSAALGVSSTQRAMEAAVLLAPRYNRAVFALMADIVRGFAGKGGLQGKLARDAFVKTTVGFMAAYVGIAKAMGQKIHLNPLDTANFMTFEIANQRVGPGPKILSHIRFVASIVAFPDSIDELTVRNPIFRHIRGQLAAMGGTSIDLLTGRDFIGQTTRDGYLQMGETVLKDFLTPIWIESVVFEGGSLREKVTRGISEFVGARSRPLYEEEQLDRYVSDLVIDSSGKPVVPESPDRIEKFEDLDNTTRMEFNAREEVREIRKSFYKGTDWDLINEETWKAWDRQRTRDEMLTNGEIDGETWGFELYKAAIESSARADVLILLGNIETKGPKNDNEKALQDYYELQEGFRNPRTNQFDSERWHEERIIYLVGLTEEQRTFVIENLHPNATRMVKDFYKLQEELGEIGWFKLHEQEPLYKEIKVWYDFIKGQEKIGYLPGKDAKLKFPNAAELVKKIDGMVRARRTGIVLGNPDIDAALFLFEGRVPRTAEGKAAALRTYPEVDDRMVLTRGPTGPQLTVADLGWLSERGLTSLVSIADVPEGLASQDPWNLREQALEIIKAQEELEDRDGLLKSGKLLEAM